MSKWTFGDNSASDWARVQASISIQTDRDTRSSGSAHCLAADRVKHCRFHMLDFPAWSRISACQLEVDQALLHASYWRLHWIPVIKTTHMPWRCTGKLQSIESVFKIPDFRAAVLTLAITNIRGSGGWSVLPGVIFSQARVGALSLEAKCPQYFRLRLMASVQRKVNWKWYIQWLGSF